MGIVRADSSCGFLGMGGEDCKEKRDTVRRVCGTLTALNLNLYDACVNACNADNRLERPYDTEDFLCNFIGGEALFKLYGLENQCGYNPFQSSEGKLAEKTNEKQSQQNTFIQRLSYAVVLVIVGILFWKFL